MARRIFERKSRLQNQSEMRVSREKFGGMYADVPASELDRSSLHDAYNAFSNYELITPRGGAREQRDFVLPPATAGSFVFEKSYSDVTLTGHSASEDFIGAHIVYSNGSTPDTITGVINTWYVVDNGDAVPATGTCSIQWPVYGHLWHKESQTHIVHTGSNLYKITPTGNITTVVLSGGAVLAKQNSQIVALGSTAVIFCAGIYKIDLTNNLYWQTNIDNVANTLYNTWYSSTGYHRRYMWTMARMSGTDALYNDSSTLNVDTEGGSNLLDSDLVDWKALYTAGAVGPETTTYSLLTCGSGPTLASLVGSYKYFDITIDSTLYTITYSTATTITFTQLANIIQTQMRTLIGPDCYCTYSGRFSFRNKQAGSTIGYLSTPATVTGWTDVSATLLGTAATGAAITSAGLYSQCSLTQYTTPTSWKMYTHYSFYGTKQLVTGPAGVEGNVNSYALLYDVPIMHTMSGSTASSTLTITVGEILDVDVGTWVTMCYYEGGVWSAIQRQVAFKTSSTVAVFTEALGTHAAVYCYVGAQKGFYGSASGGVVTVTNWLTTHSTTKDYTPALTAPTLAIGDPIFMSNGSVYYIKAMTSATSFTLDRNLNGAFFVGATEPKPSTAFYGNVVVDNIGDDVISARLGTLGLKTRFFRANPAVNVGVITPGWMMTGLGNMVYWCALGLSQQYVLGVSHPTYQTQEIGSDVVAFGATYSMLTIFTRHTTYTTQTNLDIKYNDTANGNVIYTLPQPVIADAAIGVREPTCVLKHDRDMLVTINSDGGVRTWNGYQYSEDMAYQKIKKLLVAAARTTLGYDTQYGVLIWTSANGRSYNNCYAIAVTKDGYVGVTRLTELSTPYMGVQAVACDKVTDEAYNDLTGNSERAAWFNSQTVIYTTSTRVRFVAACFTTFPQEEVRQDQVVTGYGSNQEFTALHDIPWGFTTGDDTASQEHSKLRHLESHLYVQSLVDGETNKVDIVNTIYSDTGVKVTQESQVNVDLNTRTDLSYDARIEGRRLRRQVAISKATVQVSGLDSYYVAYDKAAPIANRLTSTESTDQALVAAQYFGLSRVLYIDEGTGTPYEVSGTTTKSTGPDGRTGTSLSIPQDD